MTLRYYRNFLSIQWLFHSLTVTAALAPLLLMSGCSERSDYYGGEYELVAGLQPDSYERVIVEEILNLSCKPCYEMFTHGSKQLKERFGDRVEIVLIPVVFTKQTQHPVRLFIIASESGKGEAVVGELYRRYFDQSQDIFDEDIVLEVAEQFGLKSSYEKNKNADWVEAIYQSNRSKAIRYQITETPTLIVQHQLKSVGGLENAALLIDSLLL